MQKNTRKGFTLIELLVVIAIIGLLSTLAVVALNSARAKSRDAKRVSDVKQVQTALELFFADNGGYPKLAAAGGLDLGGASSLALCDVGAGFAASCGAGVIVFMGLVPANPTPNGAAYHFTGRDSAGADCNGASGSCASYTMTFTLEADTGTLRDGVDANATPDCTADANGITCL